MKLCSIFSLIFMSVGVICVEANGTDTAAAVNSSLSNTTSRTNESTPNNQTTIATTATTAHPLSTVLAFSTPPVCVAIVVAFTLIILRRRKKAKLRARKYALALREAEEKRRNRLKSRIEPFAKAEDHRYEEIVAVGDDDIDAGQSDKSTNHFSQYLKYIQKDAVPSEPDNEVMNCKQKDSTPKVQIDACFNNNKTGVVPSQSVVFGGGGGFNATRPVKELGSTGFLSTLLNRQSEIRRTKTTKSRKSSGYALRKAASEWNNEVEEKVVENKTRSEENIAKKVGLVYFELERTDSTNDAPMTDSRNDAHRTDNTIDAPMTDSTNDAPRTDSKNDAPMTDSRNDAHRTDSTNDAPRTDSKNDAPMTDSTNDAPRTDSRNDEHRTDSTNDAPRTDRTNDAPK